MAPKLGKLSSGKSNTKKKPLLELEPSNGNMSNVDTKGEGANTKTSKKKKRWSMRRKKKNEPVENLEAPTALGICCGRSRAELSHPAFSAREVTGQVLNGPNSFAPAGLCTLLAKTIVMSWSMSLFVIGLLSRSEPPMAFFFAYLTNITLLIACLYLLLSWWNSLLSTICTSTTTNIGWMHHISWALFAVAAPGEIIVTVGYWTMDWDGKLTTLLDYYNIMTHGGVMILVLLEGLFINRIPLRVRHYGLLALYMMAYLIWTFVHAWFLIGDPTSEDDDAIYEGVLEWNKDPLTTAGYAALFFFGLAPVSFVLVYVCSLYTVPCFCCLFGARRRYVVDGDDMTVTAEDDASQASTSYVEMPVVPKKKKKMGRWFPKGGDEESAAV
ncbi:expressed unknown protein [Seminavis robusta]|uniref:Uncharacterized protein n=1 Tax=Seminavis robusta TaxID=568900 RepID=A0A9N8HN03_9STRA|nr:expressed unknown protein [Seminavis robusta]|eukprot:Sro786_g202210.1 n/a (384) ;mRNA; r:4862-6013